ncbi:DUF3892 domain-containing protein [Isoptericola croceus]|uniref:DUF3892 domain-containing protein n=1 Tax=Isoptericola croceus TaxID=3031406 RepID=UPI0023F70217|nr:DUF3892 domain-containing protein [Isoptericola croceus]
MTDMRVTHSGKDRQGDIISIGVKDQWVESAETAIKNIELGRARYYVPWQSGSTWIKVVNGTTGKYLRTDRDGTARNNLDDLPDL